MSALLPEPFIAVTPTLVRAYGAVSAIVLQFVHFASLKPFIGGPAGECTLYHREIADETGLSADQVWRAAQKLSVEHGVLNAERRGDPGGEPQAGQRVTYSINYDLVPDPESAPPRNRGSGAPPRNRGGTSAESRRTPAESRRCTTSDVGGRTPEEVEESNQEGGCEFSSSSNARAYEPAADDDDDDGAAADGGEGDGSGPVPSPLEPGGGDGPVESLIRDLTRRAPSRKMRLRLRAALERGWTVGEINRRLQHAAGAANRSGYIVSTLTDLAGSDPSWRPPEGGWAGGEEHGEGQEAGAAGPVSRSREHLASERRPPETMSPEQPDEPQEVLDAQFAKRYPEYRPVGSPAAEPTPPEAEAGDRVVGSVAPRVVPVREGRRERTPDEAEAEVRRMMAKQERARRANRPLDLGGGG